MQVTWNSVLGSGFQDSSRNIIIHFTVDHCNSIYCYTRGVWGASIHLSNRTTAHQVEHCCFDHSITQNLQAASQVVIIFEVHHRKSYPTIIDCIQSKFLSGRCLYPSFVHLPILLFVWLDTKFHDRILGSNYSHILMLPWCQVKISLASILNRSNLEHGSILCLQLTLPQI
jgi:hypothetical protein